MPPRPRIASMSVASAAAIGLSVAIGVAPPAFGEPCTGAAAAAQPPAAPPPIPSLPSSPGGLPTGHRPPNTNERAPLPRLGQLPLAILNALTPRSARVRQQAGVMPSPIPPGTGNPPPPNATAQVPAAAAAAPPPVPAAAPPPGTSVVGWVTGPDSPNNTMRRSRSPGPTSGSCGTTAIPSTVRC